MDTNQQQLGSTQYYQTNTNGTAGYQALSYAGNTPNGYTPIDKGAYTTGLQGMLAANPNNNTPGNIYNTADIQKQLADVQSGSGIHAAGYLDPALGKFQGNTPSEANYKPGQNPDDANKAAVAAGTMKAVPLPGGGTGYVPVGSAGDANLANMGTQNTANQLNAGQTATGTGGQAVSAPGDALTPSQISQKALAATQAAGGTPPQSSGAASGVVNGAINANTPPPTAPTTSPAVTSFLQSDPVQQQVQTLTQQFMPQATTDQLNQQIQKISTDQNTLVGLNTQLMNIDKVMAGTTNDLRAEIQAANGFATESQVAALAVGRNKTLLQQATQIQDQITSQNQMVANDTSLLANEKDMANQQFSQRTQIYQMAQTNYNNMVSAAKDGAQGIINTLGYGALLASLHSDPTAIANTEKVLGYTPGQLQQLATQQENAQNLSAITAAGITTPYVNKNGEIQNTATGQGYSSMADFQAKTGMSLTDAQAKGLVSIYKPQDKLTSVSPGSTLFDPTTGKAVYTAPTAASQNGSGGGGGSGGGYVAGADPVADAWVNAVKNGNATMAQVPANEKNKVALGLNQSSSSVVNPDQDQQVKAIIAANPGEYGKAADAIDKAFGAGSATKYDAQLKAVYNQKQDVGTAFNSQTFSPLASSRFATASNRITSNFIQLPQYQLTANGLPYLQRIQAAMQNPGSISDQDLLDSLTKLNTAGNAISDAQVKLITDGKSFSDTASTLGNKFKNGGVLSDSQRQQIQTIAQAIYNNYKTGYQPVYDQVTQQLTQAGIPKAFWTIPDLNTLSNQGQVGTQSDSSGGDYNAYLQAIGGGQ